MWAAAIESLICMVDAPSTFRHDAATRRPAHGPIPGPDLTT
jgi:hypothetical protein